VLHDYALYKSTFTLLTLLYFTLTHLELQLGRPLLLLRYKCWRSYVIVRSVTLSAVLSFVLSVNGITCGRRPNMVGMQSPVSGHEAE